MPGSTYVLDASALAAVIFDEPQGIPIEKELREGRLVAPSLIGYEIASVALKKMHDQPDHMEGILESLRAVEQSALELMTIPPISIARLSRQAGISAYDGSYLWLAVELAGTLVTLDQELIKSAERLGVPCLPTRP
jgi:predicted nucleic acid-binding protein